MSTPPDLGAEFGAVQVMLSHLIEEARQNSELARESNDLLRSVASHLARLERTLNSFECT